MTITKTELERLYASPLLELVSKAHAIHCQHHDPLEVQVCHLISIKTGGCPEDCKYCAQSSRYQTEVQATPLLSYDEVMSRAKEAVNQGATRVCLGAAWRLVRDSKQFDAVLEMVKGITALGVEVCCTLGMLTAEQAQKLKQAGLYAYNHNLDSSKRFYETIITTRTYEDRLETLKIVRDAELQVCCGGIFGLGEEVDDRLELLKTLADGPAPESIPINRLEQIAGTPLANVTNCSSWEIIRMTALTRIVFPTSFVRLTAGRATLSMAEQALCFLAGVNSIFSSEKLLTVKNTGAAFDAQLFETLGLKKRDAYKPCQTSCCS